MGGRMGGNEKCEMKTMRSFVCLVHFLSIFFFYFYLECTTLGSRMCQSPIANRSNMCIPMVWSEKVFVRVNEP